MNDENNTIIGFENNETENHNIDPINYDLENDNGGNGKKSKKKLFLLIPIILVLLIAAGVLYYFTIYTRADQVYKRLVSGVLNNGTEQFIENKNVKLSKGEISLDADIQLNQMLMFFLDEETKSILDLVNKTNITLGTQLDMENQKFVVDLDSKYDNAKLLNAKLFADAKNEKTYVYLKDFLDKYIEVENVDYEEVKNFLQTKDLSEVEGSIKDFKNELKREILKSITTEYCSNIEEEIELNGEKVNVTKNTFKIKYSQYIKEVTQILERIKNNEKLLNCLTETGREDFLDVVEDLLEELKDTRVSDEEDSTLEINIYTKDFLMNEVVKIDFEIIEDNEENNLLVTIVKNSEQEWAFNIQIDEANKVYGKLNLKDENSGNFVINVDIKETANIMLNIGYKVENNIILDAIDSNKATKLEALTSEEQTTFMTNLQKSKLYEIISKYMQDDSESNVIDDGNELVYNSDIYVD